jgi:two-component system, NtrC family, sensor kinase
MTPSDSTAPAVTRVGGGRTSSARRLQLQEGLRRLLHAFSRTASSALNLPAALAVLCHEATGVFGARRASAWLHDRRSHELVLAASSGITPATEGLRLRTDSAQAPAAALRDEGARWIARCGEPAVECLTIPLRGHRRALGVLLVEGVSARRARGVGLVEEADEFGRHLSTAIENLLLIEDVLRSRRELAHTFDSLEDLVAVCDAGLTVVHANRALVDRLARPRERVLGQPLGGLVGDAASAWLASAEVADVLRASTTGAREVDDPALGGRFAITLTPLPGPDGSPSGAVFVARDVSNRARLEAERAALRERLTQAEKLAALGQFIAGIAHELNNPLQGVLGHVELLRRQGRVPRSIRREMGLVFREADRAARIVDNLLVFAGGRSAALRPLALNVVIAQAIALRAPACRAAAIELVRRFDESNPRVAGNRLLLQQALFNVLLNAEQELAPRGGGRIEISTRLVELGDTVRIQVRDTGPGLPAEALPRLFEPFYTTKEVGRGTGLGLAITYGIVKDHHGVVTAGNHPDGGAVFTIELPVVAPRARTARKPSRRRR